MKRTSAHPGKKNLLPSIYDAIFCLLFLAVLSLGLPSCAPKKPGAPMKADPPWTNFIHLQNTLQTVDSFSIRTSINYSSAKHKHRVIMRIFGKMGYPIRMDIQAGIGRTISIWREDEGLWQAYFPEEKRMYNAIDGQVGVRSLGFPSPFDLKELAHVLQGHILPVLPAGPVREEIRGANARISFARSSRINSLVVDRQGRARELRGAGGWRVVFDYRDASPYSHKISMDMENGEKAVIRIKSVSPGTFGTDLAINPPKGTEIVNIAPPARVQTGPTKGTPPEKPGNPE
ncbi:hypothetical protein [Desulfoplanes sp.]